jgi:hypothetical protein
MKARDNPFRSARVEALRFRTAGPGLDVLIERLAQLDYRAAIVGDHGSGKTTLLEELQPFLVARGFQPILRRFFDRRRRFAPDDWRRLANADSSHAVLVDGAECLGTLGLRRLCRRVRPAGALLITCHRRCLLPTLIHCRTDADLLADLVAELLGVPAREIDVGSCRRLIHRHRGNLRTVLRELYDAFAHDPTAIAPLATAL